MTTIKLADLDEFKVTALIAASAEVAKWNRNKNHAKPLLLVTDDIEVYNTTRPRRCRHLSQRTTLWGHYTRNGMMWLKPLPNVADQVHTLAHELAHHYTTGRHDSGWRRMYAMMLVLSAQVFAGQAHTDFHGEILNCVGRYVKPHRDMSRRYDFSRPALTMTDFAMAELAAQKQMTAAMTNYRRRFPLAATTA